MTTVPAARQEWYDGHRRFEDEALEARAEMLHAQRDAVLEEAEVVVAVGGRGLELGAALLPLAAGRFDGCGAHEGPGE